MLEAACVDARRWIEHGAEALPIAINLSAQQFDDPRLLDDMDRVLLQTGFDPFQLASQNDLAIATAIIAMGHTMGMKVIAEGVETDQQLQILRRCGCDDFQRFLFSPAVTAATAGGAGTASRRGGRSR